MNNYLESFKKLLIEIGNYPLVTGFEHLFVDELLKIARRNYKKAKRIGLNILNISEGELSNLVLISHYDEVGFVVDNQYAKNLYRTIPFGLMSWERGYGKVFQTHFKGRIIKAIGSSPLPHSSSEENRLFLELEEEIDLPPLYPFTFENKLIEFKDRIFTKSLDDRAGVVSILLLAKELGFSFILSHGEEQGTTRFLESLEFIEEKVENPLYIILDSFPSKEDEHYKGIVNALGKGEIGFAGVEGKGLGNIAPKELIELLREIGCKEIKTSSRWEVTDATTLYRLGRKAIAMGYPLKYLHSSLECIYKETILNIKQKLEELRNAVVK